MLEISVVCLNTNVQPSIYSHDFIFEWYEAQFGIYTSKHLYIQREVKYLTRNNQLSRKNYDSNEIGPIERSLCVANSGNAVPLLTSS